MVVGTILRSAITVIHCCALSRLVAGTLQGSQLSVGGSGWALRFDGTDDLVAVFSEMPPPPVTLEMWIHPMDLFDGSGERVVRFHDAGVVLSQASFQNARNLFAILYNGNQVWHQDTTIHGISTVDGVQLDEANGLLYHYAYVRNESAVCIYVNGELVQEGTLSSTDDVPAPDPLPWLLGARWTKRGGVFATERNFGGVIDEMRWWRVARSVEEVRHYSQLGVPDDHPSLMRQWRCDEGDGMGGATFSLGGSDPALAPAWVPSVVGGSGGPVALSTTEGAPAQEVEICALLLPPSPGARLSLTFLTDSSLGQLGDAPPAIVEMREAAPLKWVNGQRYCGVTPYTPISAGREEIEFAVTAILPSGEQVMGSQSLQVRISPNRRPSAGVARAVRTNGVDSYVSLGSWDLAERFSWALWVDPVAVQDNAFLISRHLGDGKNIFLFGWQAGKFMLRIDCRAGCTNPDGSTPIVRWFVPEGADTDLVLDTGWTVSDVKEARSKLQHVGGTFECHFRGDESSPPRATVTIYLNGLAIGHSDDFPACITTPTNEEAHEGWDTRPTPWHLGQEYDSADEIGEHMPGLKVKPSDHANAVFDEVVFWNRSLSAAEMLRVSWGKLPEEDLTIHYTFDLDDPALCAERQLYQRSLHCLGVNEAKGRTTPSSYFPWTNAYINGVEAVRSPFPRVPGSPVYKVLLSGTCANMTLQGSDADGDALTFYPFLNKTGIEFFRSIGSSGELLEFCDIHNVGRREVIVQFNACDLFGSCASPYGSGLGLAIFQMLAPGPRIISFQALPHSGKLRVIFDMPTNTPTVDNEEQVGSLVSLDPPQRLLFGAWENGGAILQLIMSDSGWLARGLELPKLSITIPKSAGLRDAELEKYPSVSSFSGLVDKTCTNGTVLLDGVQDCVPCQPGQMPVVEGTERVCQPCGVGEFADSSRRCELCAPGTWSDVAGASACVPCTEGKTTPRGARSVDECGCPAGTFNKPTLVDGNLTVLCAGCGEGLQCPGEGQALLLEGYSAIDPEEVYLCRQDIKRCPGGPLGTCAAGRDGLSCSLCLEGKIPNDDGTCQECSDGNIVPTVAFATVVLVCLGLLYVRIDRENASTESRSLVLVGIACQQLITCFQMFSVTAQIRVNWHEPIKTLFRLMQLLVVDVDLVNVNCVGTFSPLSKYISRLLLVAAAVAVVSVFHVVSVIVFYNSQFGQRMASLLGVIGSVFMMFYISILGTILLSMQCDDNPSGKWTVNAYPSIVCWEGGDHVPMVVVALVALVIPVSFLAKCAQVVWVAPRHVQQMDLDFLQTYSFLFKRFRPETRWFSVAFLLRSALIAFIPIVTIIGWKIMILQMIMIGSMLVTAFFRPWRAKPAAFIDISSSMAVVIILTLVAFQAGEAANGELMATIATLGIVGVLLGVAATVVIGIYFFLLQNRKIYQYFICHHKADAGATARLLKMVLVESPRVTRKVFLDADDLVHLDMLFDFVRHHCETLAVLCSSQILTRPWCVGEITTAHINKVTTLPVLYGDFSHPEEAWLRQVARRVNLTSLAPFGIDEGLVQMALRALPAHTHLEMPSLLTQAAVLMLQKQILRGSPLPTDAPELTNGQQHAQVIVGADALNVDAVAAARVLSKLVVAWCSTKVHLAPVLAFDLMFAADDEENADTNWLPAEAKVFVMVCTSGCFDSIPFLVNLCDVVAVPLETVPVVASSEFRFPTSRFYKDLHKKFELNGKLLASVSPPTMIEYVSRVFKRIAVVYSPHSSLALMQAQASEVFKQMNHSMADACSGTMSHHNDSHVPLDAQSLIASTRSSYSSDAEEEEAPVSYC